MLKEYQKVCPYGTYYAFGLFGSGWLTKAIHLSGGETVTLKTANDFK